MNWITNARRSTYTVGRLLGDLNAVTSAAQTGKPDKIVKRLVNKWIGRNLVSKMWWR